MSIKEPGLLRRVSLRALRRSHRTYKVLLSPLFGNACRFEPYCSDYAVEAIEVHGFAYGSFLAIKRILRCHPYCNGGADPVPQKPLRSR